MDYTLYNPTTGEVVQTGGGSAGAVEIISRAGTSKIVGRAVPGCDRYIDVATLVDLSRPVVSVDRTSAPRNQPFLFSTPIGTKIWRDPTPDDGVEDWALVTTTTVNPYDFRSNVRGAFLIWVDPPFPTLGRVYRVTVT